MARAETVMRVRLTGDADGAVRAFRDMATEMARTDARYKDVAEAFIRESDRIEAKAKQTADQVQAQQRRFGGDGRGAALGRLDDLAGQLPGGNLLSDLGGVEAVLGGISTKAAAAGVAIAGLAVATVELGKVSIANFQDLAGSVVTLQQIVGGTAEEVSGLEVAVRKAGVESDEFRDLMLDLSTEVQDKPDQFRRWGVEIARTASGTVDLQETLFNLLETARGLDDVTQQRDLLNELLGEDTAREALPLLRADLESLAKAERGVFSEETLARAEDLRMAQAELSAEWQVATARIGAELAPALTTLVRVLADVVDVGGDVASALLDAAGVAFGPVVSGVKLLAAALELAEDPAGKLADKLGDAIGNSTVGAALGNVGADVRRATQDLVADFEAEARAAESARAATDRNREALNAAVSARATAASAAAAAARGMADAEEQAARTISDAARQGAQQVEAAASRIAQARRSQADAAEALGKAERDAARSIADANERAAEMVAAATERVGEARERAAEAARGVTEAEAEAAERVAQVVEDGARRIVDAQRRVDEARERSARTARDNARRLEDSDRALQDALNRALLEENPFEAQRIREEALLRHGRVREDVAESEQDAAARVLEAEQGLRDAQVEAAEARAQAEEDAADRIGEARKRAEEAARAVEQAERDLERTSRDADRLRADAAEQASERIESARRRVSDAAAAVYSAEVAYQQAVAAVEQAKIDAANRAADLIEQARQREIDAAKAVFEAEYAYFLARQPLTPTQQFYSTPQVQSAPVTRPWEARASGGPAMAGGMYLVGEDGPEVLQMGSMSGWVHPSGAMPGGNTYIIQGSVISERELVEIIARAERGGYGR